MDAKALVLSAALVAIAGTATATGSADSPMVTGDSPERIGHRPRAGRDGEHARVNHGAAGGHVQDDYAEALAQARRRHVPVVVDVWAPW